MSITNATEINHIWEMWLLLKKDGITDENSIRMFEGHLYSLIDDNLFYEGSGRRKHINILLFYWDAIRAITLKDEVDQVLGTRTIVRTDEEQLRMDEFSNHFHEWLLKTR